MKDSMADNPRKRSLKQIALVTAAILAALAGIAYMVLGSLASGRINPLALLVLAAAVSIAIPMIRTNFFPSERDYAAEYAFHEQRLEKEIVQTIGDALGPETLNRLFGAPGQYHSGAADELRALLNRDQVRRNPDLHFAVLVALARWHEKKGDPEAAIAPWLTALEIRPRGFIARMHLAGNLEWIGDVEDARRHYGTILERPQELSVAMKKMVTAKITQGSS